LFRLEEAQLQGLQEKSQNEPDRVNEDGNLASTSSQKTKMDLKKSQTEPVQVNDDVLKRKFAATSKVPVKKLCVEPLVVTHAPVMPSETNYSMLLQKTPDRRRRSFASLLVQQKRSTINDSPIKKQQILMEPRVVLTRCDPFVGVMSTSKMKEQNKSVQKVFDHSSDTLRTNTSMSYNPIAKKSFGKQPTARRPKKKNMAWFLQPAALFQKFKKPPTTPVRQSKRKSSKIHKKPLNTIRSTPGQQFSMNLKVILTRCDSLAELLSSGSSDVVRNRVNLQSITPMRPLSRRKQPNSSGVQMSSSLDMPFLHTPSSHTPSLHAPSLHAPSLHTPLLHSDNGIDKLFYGNREKVMSSSRSTKEEDRVFVTYKKVD
jgi:hypothetical protein